ncbi:MAG: hypothetical protein ACSHX6_08125 [Akkermansiaceae bacterium]
MNPEEEQDVKNAKSAKKFLWILMLIPIGLAVGVVTSNINFRKAEDEKAELEQFKVSQIFDRTAIKDDMEKVVISVDESSDYFLRHISSTLGINNYLTIEPGPGYGANVGYYDIKGDNEEVITAVIVELDEVNPVAKSALLAVPTAVIKSMAGEKDFSNTLRFIFLPKKYDGNVLNLKHKGEELKSQITIRAGGGFTINDDISWRKTEGVWQHPAMAYPHESVSDYVTPGQVELALQAALQLKEMLSAEMQK